jgi:hypothetical protein
MACGRLLALDFAGHQIKIGNPISIKIEKSGIQLQLGWDSLL